MKKFFVFVLPVLIFLTTTSACAQADKSTRPSPPATVSETISSGATIKINYSVPSLKGRTIGKDVEPIKNELWRAGANEATTFEVDKDVMVAGKSLPAGKYAFFVMVSDDGVHLIFNKKWDTWGAFDYKKNKAQDALQVTVLAGSNEASIEKLIYTIDKNSGIVSLAWGLWKIEFAVQ